MATGTATTPAGAVALRALLVLADNPVIVPVQSRDDPIRGRTELFQRDRRATVGVQTLEAVDEAIAVALVNGPDGPEFQALKGTWRLGPNGLVLDDAPPVPVAKAAGHVRIAAPTGAVILRRSELR